MLLRNISARTLVLRDVSNNEYHVPAYGDLTISSTLWSDSTFRQWARMRVRDIVVIDDIDSENVTLAAFGMKGWTIRPMAQTGNGLSPTSQRIHFTALPLNIGDVITNVWVSVAVAAVGTTPTTIKLALLSKNGNRLAITTNLAADVKWTSLGFKSFSFITPYTVPAGDIYMAALLKDGAFGTTDVQLGRVTSGSTALNGVWVCGQAGTSQVDIGVGPLTYAVDSNAFWFAVN